MAIAGLSVCGLNKSMSVHGAMWLCLRQARVRLYRVLFCHEPGRTDLNLLFMWRRRKARENSNTLESHTYHTCSPFNPKKSTTLRNKLDPN